MQKVLRHIAIRGGLSALVLLAIGFILTEVAARSFFAPDAARTPKDPAVAATKGIDAMWNEMRTTIPFSMAIWGFVIVAVLELLRHFLTRGQKPVPVLPPPPPDETEKLLEELLTQAESKAAAPSSAVAGSRTHQPSEVVPAKLQRQGESATRVIPETADTSPSQAALQSNSKPELPPNPPVSPDRSGEDWENLGKHGHWW